METSSQAAPTASAPPVNTLSVTATAARSRLSAIRRPRPELIGLLALAGVLNLWGLSRNGWANDYYSAAVRSMSTSWHNFLFASLDQSGVMTVDKPPLALWVQALSVRAFGYHPLAILIPQALMGMASVALLYDLVRRRFGRTGGAIAGLTLALTPITVAISRHNNPDALLVLCMVGALWCAVRAFEAGPTGRSTRWLVASGVCVGLGFETKMLVAMVVVPGIAAAWLWVAPAARGRLHALRQLLAGGGAMLLVGGAWPLLVELTPASSRPWISGTSDNRIWSLIFEYNGLGRVEGQQGGPGGIGGNMFGGSAGPLRLLNSALGGQDGWLLGFALLSGLAILAVSRLRPRDERTGWLLMIGGAFATTAVLFSFAGGIFHPYYVSLLAPFAAALLGAGASQLLSGRINARIFGPPAIIAGVASELVVLGDYPGQLRWLVPVLIVVGLIATIALLALAGPRVRIAAVGAALATLLVAPTVWAFDTLGHATSGTFPEGGPASVQSGFARPRRCRRPRWRSRLRRGHRRRGTPAVRRRRPGGALRGSRCRRCSSGRGRGRRRRDLRSSRHNRRRCRRPGLCRPEWVAGRPRRPGRRGRLRRQRSEQRDPLLRQGPWRRDDRRGQPVGGRLGDHQERRRCCRDRRLLGTGELGQHLLAGPGGPLGSDPLGDRRKLGQPDPGRREGGLESGHGGGGQGLHEGDPRIGNGLRSGLREHGGGGSL